MEGTGWRYSHEQVRKVSVIRVMIGQGKAIFRFPVESTRESHCNRFMRWIRARQRHISTPTFFQIIGRRLHLKTKQTRRKMRVCLCGAHGRALVRQENDLQVLSMDSMWMGSSSWISQGVPLVRVAGVNLHCLTDCMTLSARSTS